MDLVAIHAANKPDAPALVEGDRALTWAEYDELKNRCANALLSLGLGPDDRVIAYHHNSIEGVVVSSAADVIGLTVVPMNHRLTAPEVAYIVDDSDAAGVVYGPEFGAVIRDVRADARNVKHWICLGEPGDGDESFAELCEDASPERPESVVAGGGSMIYTSGTTGRPKGAYRRPGAGAGAAAQMLGQILACFDLRPDDTHLAAGPLYHSAPRYFAMIAGAIGNTTVLMRRFDAAEALRLLERHRVGNAFMAPVLVKRLLDAPGDVWEATDTSSLHTLIVAGAPCPMSVKEDVQRRLGEVLYEFYGSTELGINTYLKPADQLRKPGSCGVAFPGIDVHLLDTKGDEVPDGTPGELYVRRHELTFSEYYNRPEALADASRGDLISVGDIAYRDDEGFYFICDRKTDMIISGGVNIYPAEIEDVLHAHPDIADVAVFGIPDDDWGESVHAVVQVKPGGSLTPDALRGWCEGRLADYKRPRTLEFVDELPRDQAGKLIKRQLRDQFWAGREKKVN